MAEQKRILIPGGEISLNPAGTWTNDKGQLMNKGASVGISFGRKFVSLRADLAKVLFEAMDTNDEIRGFIGL